MTPYDLASSAFEARTALEKRYFSRPNSLDPMTPVYKTGLIPVAVFAMMSLISVFSLLSFITYRLITWRKYYKEYVGYNQYVILIYNLLLADLQQAIAFTMTFHWLRLERIVAPTVPCFIQAWFLQIGDVSSGFFVLAIAIHTWLGVVKGYRMPYQWFVVVILCIWAVSLLLTLIGPAIYGNRFFTRAGGWCWVSVDFQSERLYLHYLWIFIIEVGTLLIYAHIFFHLRGRLRSIINNDSSKLARATKFMVMYPAVYVVLTLPIAIGRMVSMGGVNMPDVFFCIAGSFLTSCGWIDALLYTLTRRVFVGGGEVSGHHYNRTLVTTTATNAARPGDTYGMQSMNKDPIPPTGARTVTIVGGSNRISRIVDKTKPSDRSTRKPQRSRPVPLREHSPNGSEDSIMKPGPNAIGIVTETNIQVESTRDSDSDLPSPSGSRPFRRQNDSNGNLSDHSTYADKT
ncbi:hypothetical protein P280DRAFT_249801 [Massarina eburnea CBS 473.64]|uniref:G-protein coupled receptors family 1 profile domain-containing protein n=1 Tax=Massarina eburnea CBS 473.64 TaxID=1395130 RepID=A0A6A6S6R4_9PLEO|nr:hypothetical protein P280DRAFT_249801 [Massarina eburnea CBS 473.64]